MKVDLSAPIVPGRSSAGIPLGIPVADIPMHRQPDNVRELHGVTLFDFGDVRVWVCEGHIHQIGVRGRYTGRVKNDIGIGSTLEDVASRLGPLFEDDEDNLVVRDLPGICLETEAWSGTAGTEALADNMQARVTEVFVYTPYAAQQLAPTDGARRR